MRPVVDDGDELLLVIGERSKRKPITRGRIGRQSGSGLWGDDPRQQGTHGVVRRGLPSDGLSHKRSCTGTFQKIRAASLEGFALSCAAVDNSLGATDR
jgi:hypothetical protein